MRFAAIFVALACLPLVAAAGEAPKPALPFIEDDYGKALEQATKKKLPLFVEAWAPW